MKLTKSIVLMMFMGALLAMSSCSKDDDKDSSSKSFSYDGSSYSLSQGYLLDVGPNSDGSHDFDVFLISDGISGGLFGFSGTGDGVYLDLNSSSDMDLLEGTYNFETDRAPFAMVAGSSIIIDYNFDTEEGTEVLVTGGSVNVGKDGDDYEIEFNLETSDGKTIEGIFEGELQRN